MDREGGALTHDALTPGGPQAASIARLIALYGWVSFVVLGLVLLFLGLAVLRRRGGPDAALRVALPPSSGPASENERALAPPDPAAERRLARWVGAATG